MKYNWALQLKQIFTQIQRPDVWSHLSGCILRRSRSELLSSYADHLRNLDLAAAAASSFLLFPSLIARDSASLPAIYLTWNVPIHVTRIMAQIRLANNRGVTFSSAGNFFFIDSNVQCTLCNLQKRELLSHILSECPIYRPIRSELILGLVSDGSPAGLENVSLQQAKLVAAFITSMLRIRAFIMNE